MLSLPDPFHRKRSACSGHSKTGDFSPVCFINRLPMVPVLHVTEGAIRFHTPVKHLFLLPFRLDQRNCFFCIHGSFCNVSSIYHLLQELSCSGFTSSSSSAAIHFCVDITVFEVPTVSSIFSVLPIEPSLQFHDPTSFLQRAFPINDALIFQLQHMIFQCVDVRLQRRGNVCLRDRRVFFHQADDSKVKFG